MLEPGISVANVKYPGGHSCKADVFDRIMEGANAGSA
jgi:hypothetical protein